MSSQKQLKRAAQLRERIEKLEAQLRAVLGYEGKSVRAGRAASTAVKKTAAVTSRAKSAPAKPAKKAGGKRTLSPEALERIREGQRKRWAKVKRRK
jgi:hypothetical protein